MRYTVVSQEVREVGDWDNFISKIRTLMDNGYTLQGGASVVHMPVGKGYHGEDVYVEVFHQTMIKEE